MNKTSKKLVSLIGSLIVLTQTGVRANDNIFPPQSAAEAVDHFDGKGFVINGERTFVVSAGMEYARVPRELWADRLMRFKRAGFNCTESYIFWNYHEPQSGQFDFAGNRDLDAYLKLAKSLGLYAIARVGPYSCAEWDSGGFPIWLRFTPGLEVRTANAPFEQYVGRFWDHLLPIVTANQINRGGNVILVQLENEHPYGWGTDGASNPYFQFLQNAALTNGLEVPYFFSGLHHGNDPAGNRTWGSASRTSPWFTTEFWCDWFSDYGETPANAREKDWDTWKVIAYGGNGYNYYMAHGGTDFDYFNNDEDAASYDYGSAVGQTGDLRPEYYKFKRAAWFARGFQDILETSDNATSSYVNASTNSAVHVTARASAAGTILFLANQGRSERATQVTVDGTAYPETGSLTLNPSEMVPVVTEFQVIPGVTLKVAPTRILGLVRQDDTTTLVTYGQPGSPAELYFSVPAETKITSSGKGLALDGTNLTLQTTYSPDAPANFSFQAGSRRVRILAVSDTLADNTWFVDVGAHNYIVCGPSYVGEAVVTNGLLQIVTETPWANAASAPVIAYGPGDAPVALSAVSATEPHPGSLTLAGWQTLSGTEEAAPNFDAAGWFSSATGPQQMGVDGDVSSYAWYRTRVDVPTAGTNTVFLAHVADHMIPFVDGARVPAADVTANSFTANLTAGTHTLAVFTSHAGRNKLYPYVGPITEMFPKGLSGPARLLGNPVNGTQSLTQWSMMTATRSAIRNGPPTATAGAWTNYTFGTDAFHGRPGYAWFQTELPTVPSAETVIANFASVDDNAWVYLNGTLLASNTGWNMPFNVDLTAAWKGDGSNVLSVLVQNTEGQGGIFTSATVAGYQNSVILKNWMQRGGPGHWDATTDWQNLQDTMNTTGPRFFKTAFTAAPPASAGANPMWRVSTAGLSRGSIWVNGHNLGRYPEKTAAPGLYIPECWLKPGANANSLVIYDEEGQIPSQVTVQPEAGASRDVIIYRSAQTVGLENSSKPRDADSVSGGGSLQASAQ
jgi:beta-galactosidase